jgi:hypothetical protein
MTDQEGKANPSSPPPHPTFANYLHQHAPGAKRSGIKHADSSIPLSIFPISPDRICICFCGLPGRGKTHISRRLGQYLSFFHALNVKVFNVGEYRREKFGACKNAEWFDMHNEEALHMREEVNSLAMEDMLDFFRESSAGGEGEENQGRGQGYAGTGGSNNSLAILDATNSTRRHRASIRQQVRAIVIVYLLCVVV